MTLSAVNLLAGIVPMDPPFSVVFTDWLSTIPASGSATLTKVSVNRLPLGKVMRQPTPRATMLVDIKNRVDHLPPRDNRIVSPRRMWRKERSNQRPFRIGEIAIVWLPRWHLHGSALLDSDFSPNAIISKQASQRR